MICDTTGSALTRLLSALLASTALIGVGSALAQSLPTGGRVVSGGVTIGSATNGALAITQSSQTAIVNWQGFSIGQNNRVDIAQPNSQSAILNRVTGSTPSTIAGQLNANGQVYLVNPNGISITRTGQVNAAGFVASTLDTTDDDFRAGRRQFRGAGASAKVSNAGTITIGRGGYAALIGGEVSNRGTISVPLGRVGLGSGERATLDLSGDGFLQVAVPTSAAGTGALVRSSGTISADGGSVILTAAAARDMARQSVNLSGTIEAKSVSGTNGSITLSGGDGVVRVGATGRLDASCAGAESGGRVRVTGRRLDVAGSVDVSGAAGGRVRLEGSESVALSGGLAATGRSGAGGRVTATAPAIATHAALIDASGATGGGTVRIGGGRRGQGRLAHAQTVDIDAGTTIRADATQAGTGGDIVVWSDRSTRFAGTISATGGPQGGDGGQAEVSSRGVLAYDGSTILTAARGSFGTLLLDPYNVTISNGADTGGFTAGADDSVINVATLQTALGSANVTVSTGSGGSQAGNITVADAISWTAGTALTLNAANNITVNAGITFGGAANAGLNLAAGNAVAINAPIQVTGAGAVSLGYDTSSVSNLSFGLTGSGFSGGLTYRDAGGGALTTSPGNQSLTINSTAYSLLYSLIDLATVNAGAYALAGNLDASATSYTSSPIASLSGALTGLGHTISGLSITSTASSQYVGLIGNLTGTVRDIGLAGGSVQGSGTGSRVGSLVGNVLASGAGNVVVADAYASTAVAGGDSSPVGGLIGRADVTGTGSVIIDNVHASGAVSGGSSFAYIGGLIGFAFSNGTSTGQINIGNAYATGSVTGGSNSIVGGLAGIALAFGQPVTISNVYATGAVTGSGGYAGGGLIGELSTQGATSASSPITLSNAYATGAVTGASYNGGLIGNMSAVGSTANTISISNVFATGAAIGGTFSTNGGLIGFLNSGAGAFTVSNVYALGVVSGVGSFSFSGGLIGATNGSNPLTVSNAYWNTETSGTGTGVGRNYGGLSPAATGLTTGQLQGALPTGFSSADWATGTGLYPYQTSLFPGGVQVVSGTVYADGGSTPLASGNGGAVTVNVIAGGTTFGSAMTGANGHYYAFGAAGSLASGRSVLATTNANASTGATNAAALVTATGATTTSVTLYGSTLSGPTSQATLSAAIPDAKNNLVAAAGGNANAVSAIQNTTSYDLVSSASSFTIDQAVTTSGRFGVQTTASGAGITVAQPITMDSGGSLILNAAGALAINAPVNLNGAVVASLSAGFDTTTVSNVSLLEVSFGNGAGLSFNNANGTVASSSQGGTLSINGQSYTLLYNLASTGNSNAIQDIDALGLGGLYALATDLVGTGSAGNAQFSGSLVANGIVNPPYFTGTFEGLGHTITNLTISTGSDNRTGLFGSNAGTIRDIGLVGGYVDGGLYTGALVGFNGNAGATATIANAYATTEVSSASGNGHVGGLVGSNETTFAGGYATVVNAYATGAVTGYQGSFGGLVGANGSGGGTNAIVNAYATGAVTASSGQPNVGGLIGFNGAFGSQGGVSVSNVYATGQVSAGSGSIGGLIGMNQASNGAANSVTNAYWDISTSGTTNAFGTDPTGATGLSTADLQSGGAAGLGAAFAGGANGLYPYLKSFYPSGVQAISGIAYKDAGVTLLTSGGPSSNGPGLVSAAASGQDLGTVSTGANGYYYIAVANGTLAKGTSVVSYTQADPTGSGARNAATIATSTDGITLANVDVFGGTITQATSATFVSRASLLADAQAAANVAAGNLTKANATINAVTGLGFITSGASFDVDNVSGLDTLYVRTTANAPIVVSSTVNFANTGGGLGLFSGDAITVSAPVTINSGGLGLKAGTTLAINAPVNLDGAVAASLAAGFDTTNAQGVSLLNLSFGPGASLSFNNADGTFASSSQGGTLAVNGDAYSLIYSMSDLVGVNNALAGRYALATDLDATGNIYTTAVIAGGIPYNVPGFSGTLTGLGHSILNLSIVNPIDPVAGTTNSRAVGLIGLNTGTIRDLDLVGGSVTTTAVANSTGALVGFNQGVIANVSSSVAVSGDVRADYTGGLVGFSDGSSRNAAIVGSSSTGAVLIAGGTAGGLVGLQQGRNGYTATIANSFATGLVNAGFGNAAGGLVGVSQAVDGGTAVIASSYATGAVAVAGSFAAAGGLVGQNQAVRGGAIASLTNVYATGVVSTSGSDAAAGALVGTNSTFDNGTTPPSTTPIVNAHWDVTTSGRSNAFGSDNANQASNVTGLTTRQLQGLDDVPNLGRAFSVATDLGDGTTSAFAGGANGLYPYLSSFFPGGVQAVSGTVYSDAGVTALGSNAGGTVGVGVIRDGSTFGTATAGANGYYYVFGAAGTVAGTTLLAYNNTGGATLTTTNGAPAQTVNLYGKALTIDTMATSLSAAPSLITAQATSISAAGGNTTAQSAITNSTGRGFIASNSAGFTIDQNVAVASGSTFVVQTTSGGPLTVSNAVTIDGTGILGLSSSGRLAINAAVNVGGAGAVHLAFDATTLTNLSFASGSSINYGATNNSGKLAINGQNYALLYGMSDVAGVNANLTGRYALATNIDASASIAMPYTTGVIAGDGSTQFSGTFDGLGHTIADLTIEGVGNSYIGLFGNSIGTVRNLGLVGGSVRGQSDVGPLIGFNAGIVANVYASTAARGAANVGGLVGQNDGSIVNAYATGGVSGAKSAIGGGSYVGGLVGYNAGSVTNAYAAGAVTGDDYVGGLAGGLSSSGSIGNVYAAGSVTGQFAVGGLVGYNISGTIAQAYWDTQTSGLSNATGIGAGGNAVGLTTADLQGGQATNFSAAFAGGANGLYPYLASFFPGGVQAVSGFAYKDAGNTPLASGRTPAENGPTGAVTVDVIGGGNAFGSATTGANGYYYAFGAAGSILANAPVLATINANGVTGAKDSATLATLTTTPNQTGVNLYNGALAATTSAITLSAADAVASPAANAAANNNAAALSALSGATGRYYTATGASFTIDQNVTTSGVFAVSTATNAPLTVSNPITINEGGSLGLSSGGTLAINAPITVNGAGSVALAYDDKSSPTNLSFGLTGGGFSGGLTYRKANGTAATSSQGGALAISGQTYSLLYNLGSVGASDAIQDIDTLGLSGLYALATNLNGAGTTFNSALVGANGSTLNNTGAFAGTFEGLGHTITGLTIAIPTDYASVGLFSASVGTIRNIGIVSGTVSGTGLYQSLGLLAGQNYGYPSSAIIANAYATGTVSNSAGSGSIGGLVGDNYSAGSGTATIVNSFASVAVSAGQGSNAGGFAGGNGGVIDNSYATGSVTIPQFGSVGGLVGGQFGGSITNSYATGAVIDSGSSTAGGLIGRVSVSNGTAVTVSNVYATGVVTGANGNSGGLVGMTYTFGSSSSITLANAYWDMTTSGRADGIGNDQVGQFGNVTGLTTRQLQGLDQINGASFSTLANLGNGTTSAFVGGANGLYPYLSSFFPNGVQVISGTAYSDAVGTPLASNVAGAVTVNIVGGGSTLGSATTGANGYYYAFGQLGTIGNGQALLAYTNANTATGAKDSVTLATASGAPVNVTGTLQTGVNLYNGALSAPTSELRLSAAEPAVVAALNAALTDNPAALPAAVGVFAVPGSGGRYYNATGASFTIDTPVTTSNIFGVSTAAGAPLTVASPITVNTGGSLGLVSGGALAINAAVNVNGAGSVALGYDASSPTNLSFGLTGSGFTGGLTYLSSTGDALTAEVGGTLSVNGNAYTLVYTIAQLDGIDATEAVGGASMTQYGAGLTGNYALAGNLDAGGTTYTHALVNNTANGFTGTLGGLGHTITGLAIDSPDSQVGLMARSLGMIRDIGLSGGSISGYDNVGGLVGLSYGTITQVYARGSVAGSSSVGGIFVGGLVGSNYGSITQAYATGSVSGSQYLGGLVGSNNGSITQAYATGSVSGSQFVGGLVGLNYGTIAQAYATGSVSGDYTVGGLVGLNYGTIIQTYATGSVFGSQAGGLVGDNYNLGGVTDSYWDMQTSGQSSSAVGTGLTTAQFQSGALPTGFSSSAWSTDGGLYPYLTSFFPKGVQAVSGFAYTDGGVTPLASGANGAAYVSIAGDGQTLASVTTGANGYYYAIVPAGTLTGNGVAAYTQADMTTGAKDAVSYAGFTADTVTSLDISGEWRRDRTLSPSLSALNAGFAATTSGTPVAGFTLPNRSIFTFGDFTLDAALNVTGTLNLASIGNVTQTSAFSASTLLLEGSDSTSFTLTDTGNRFSQLAAAGGAIDVFDANGLTISANVANACNCLISGVSATGTVRIATAGDLTIAARGSVSGDSPVLSAVGAFINDAGAKAVTAPSGRWLVYSASPAGNTFGDLDSGNTGIWNTGAGEALTATGNRYVFATQPLLTIATTDSTKTYGEVAVLDGAYTVTGFDLGVAGAYHADAAETALSGTARVASAGSAATAAVSGSPYAITASLGTLSSALGYGFAFSDAGTLGVTERALTLTADAQGRVYGDANPALTYTVGGMGLANGDTLAGGLATDATTGSSVGRYAITQGNLAASANYAVTYDGAELSVTPRALTLTADAQSRAYGDADPALTYTVGGMGLANGDTLAGALATGATTGSGVGRYGVTQGNLGASANYAVTYAGAELSVTPRALTLTADAQSRAYGEADPALTYTVGGMGLVNGDTLAGGLATGANAGSGIGRYAITQGNLAASANYAVSYAGAELSVTPRALTLTADAQSRVYGEANPALTYTVGGMGLVNGDMLAGALGTTATMVSGVGRYAISQGSLAASTNYVVSYVGADLSVTPRALTLTADAQGRAYGEANPALTYTVGGAGLANGDTLAGGLATGANAGSGIGRYAITQGSLAASANYAVSYVGAELSVTPRALSLTADAQSRAYGEANPALTYTVGGMGLFNGDMLAGGLATIADGNSVAGFYPITQGNLSGSSNYALTYQGAVLTVTSADAPAVTAIDTSRLASTVMRSLRETGVMPFGAAGLPVPDPDAPPAVTDPAFGFVGLADPRFQGIVVCVGGTEGACFPVPLPVGAAPSAPAPRAAR